MDVGSQKPERPDDSDANTSYVSKEKYTALADEIRKWEDDFWHSRRLNRQSRTSTDGDKSPDLTSKENRGRESLATVTPAHVSSLRKFWEGLMTQEALNPLVPERQPLRQLQLPVSSLTSYNVSPRPATSDFSAKLNPNSFENEAPDLPPPPVVADEPTAPMITDTPTDLPPPPSPTPEFIDDKEDVHSKSADFIDIPDSPKQEYFVPECPSTVQPIVAHNYYNRPRLGVYGKSGTNTVGGGAFCRGVLRNWPNSSNLNESPSAKEQMPRQRSVTFEPEPGSAPGDTEVEETETEVDADVEDLGSIAHSASLRAHRSGSDGAYNYVDGESFGILESAARLANSADRYNRRLSRSNGNSSHHSSHSTPASAAARVELDLDSDEVSSLVSSSCEGISDSDSVNSEPLSGQRSSTGGFTVISPAGSSKGRKSSEGQRRISREASALLDFDCPPTPQTRQARVSRSNTEIAAEEAAALRRLERLKEVSDLLTQEKALIMELSSELTELHSTAKTSVTSSAKSSKHLTRAARYVSSTFVNETAVVDLNLRFLLACQRRQALLEELGLLHKGSQVLVPPMRGEPLRARFQLHAVRVALKSSVSDGGYAIVPRGEESRSLEVRPVKYHILALLKCVGEGRIYHTQIATLMRVADLPRGMARPAPYVDLLADIDVVPLRPDFVINIEVYCLQTGGSAAHGNGNVAFSDRQQMPSTPCPRTPSRHNEPISSPLSASAKRCVGFPFTSLLFSASKKKKLKQEQCRTPRNGQNIDLTAAFTMMSSVSIRHHDDLLFGRLPRPKSSRSSEAFEEMDMEGQCNVEMPLYLDGLPRSSPLAGPLGLTDVAVRLQSAVLKRGFLTIFDESGGMGVWMRCWCKLSADQLVFWRYPEDEMKATSATSGDGVSATASSIPIGRLDLRRIVAPWAVEAPRKICVRANTLYMRSLVAVTPELLHLEAPEKSSAPTTNSILLRASSDYKWLEQRHLMCADSAAEMESWIKQLNRALQVLQRWMPEHFARLARYDSGLVFTKPVNAGVASRLKQW